MDLQPHLRLDELEPNGMPRYDPNAGGANNQPTGSTVSYHNIHYSLKPKTTCHSCKAAEPRQILVDLNGIMRPGMNAVFGPTGSGKSSFLDVLAARKDPSGLSGDVLVDGAPQPPNFKCLSGYVVQDDVVMGTLTVRENLNFSAALRLHSSVPQEEKEARVNQLITELGLAKVADSKLGTEVKRGVSGGERKRTSIGMEMIIDPKVLFLDEPTSGLDATTAYIVMLLLKRMADRGKTIIMSIHQPRSSIYRLFDTVTMLANGKMVYQGPRDEALAHFEAVGYKCEPNDNPADFFLDVISGNFTAMNRPNASEDLDLEAFSSSRQDVEGHLVQGYKNSSSFDNTKAELQRIVQNKPPASRPMFRRITYNTSFCHQLAWFQKRNMKTIFASWNVPAIHVSITLLIGFLLGVIYWQMGYNQVGIQNRVGLLFFISVHLCYGAVVPAQTFFNERKLFMHEYTSGYYPILVYFIAKVLTEFLMRIAVGLLFSVLIYFMTGCKLTPGAFWFFVLTVIQMSLTATSLTLAISGFLNEYALVQMVMNLVNIIMMLFSGHLANHTSILVWVSWVKYLSIPRYGLAALQINEFVGLNFCPIKNGSSTLTDGITNLTNCGATLICSGEQKLDYLGVAYTTWDLWMNNIILFAMMSAFLIIAYTMMHRRNYFT